LNSMSTFNGLPPPKGAVAEPRLGIMPARHVGRAYYDQAKYMPVGITDRNARSGHDRRS
jgi:hypothetical protein